MTQKITISVPDKLHEKMMEWKDSFNFSKVFQDAISNLIQKKEDFQKRLKGDDNMAVIIERLKNEKAESLLNYVEVGKNDGAEWAKNAHYDDIQLVLVWDPNEDTYPTTDHSGFIDLFEYVIREHELMDWDDWHYDRFNPHIHNWITGFKSGVEEFWNEVKDKI